MCAKRLYFMYFKLKPYFDNCTILLFALEALREKFFFCFFNEMMFIKVKTNCMYLKLIHQPYKICLDKTY